MKSYRKKKFPLQSDMQINSMLDEHKETEDIDSLCKWGYISLEHDGWTTARDCFIRALKINPDYAPVWTGLLLADYHQSCFEDIVLDFSYKANTMDNTRDDSLFRPLDENENYRKAYLFADTELRQQLTDTDEAVKKILKEYAEGKGTGRESAMQEIKAVNSLTDKYKQMIVSSKQELKTKEERKALLEEKKTRMEPKKNKAAKQLFYIDNVYDVITYPLFLSVMCGLGSGMFAFFLMSLCLSFPGDPRIPRIVSGVISAAAFIPLLTAVFLYDARTKRMDTLDAYYYEVTIPLQEATIALGGPKIRMERFALKIKGLNERVEELNRRVGNTD